MSGHKLIVLMSENIKLAFFNPIQKVIDFWETEVIRILEILNNFL